MTPIDRIIIQSQSISVQNDDDDESYQTPSHNHSPNHSLNFQSSILFISLIFMIVLFKQPTLIFPIHYNQQQWIKVKDIKSYQSVTTPTHQQQQLSKFQSQQDADTQSQQDIQLGTVLNKKNIEDSPQFTNQYNHLINSYRFKLYISNRNSQMQSKQKMKYSHFSSEEEIQQFLDSLKWKNFPRKQNKTQLLLAAHLRWFPNERKYLEAEYYYLDNKYKIGKFEKQLPICVFSTGYKLSTKKQYEQFFLSIQRQNYTNYQVITVDDSSPDNSAYWYFRFTEAQTPRVRERSVIISNFQNINALGNRKVYIPLFCEKGSIVIDLDTDDSLIGNQVFQVYNAMYQANPQLWYIYSNYMQWDNKKGIPTAGLSDDLSKFHIPISQYRTYEGWHTSHLKSYRVELISKIPPQYFTKLKYDSITKQHRVTFHESSADRFEIYCLLELCGDRRVKYIDEFFHNYVAAYEPYCYMFEQRFQQWNSRIQTPLLPLEDLDATPKKTENYHIPNQTIETYNRYYEKYLSLKKKC